MTVKKAYVELIDFLKANENKKIASIMPQLLELVSSKQATKNFITNEAGEVTHIYCYYHKKWEALSECEYGAKKHSPSGFNSMCKEGVNQWTKQQRVARQQEGELLMKLQDGTLAPSGIEAERERIQADKDAIIPRADGKGTDEV